MNCRFALLFVYLAAVLVEQIAIFAAPIRQANTLAFQTGEVAGITEVVEKIVIHE